MFLPDDLPKPVDDGGAVHLIGMRMPSIGLRATSGADVDLSRLPGRTVVYAYPMTGVPGVELPKGWTDIPGARGCTPQTLSFQAQQNIFAALNVRIFGLSTQTPQYQKELADRLGLSFAILSDTEFKLTDALNLPTMSVEDMRLIKRLTLVINDGVIEHVFYPVFPPNKSAGEVLDWLRDQPSPGDASPLGSGVTIFTTTECPYCKAAKALLSERGIDFTEIDVGKDADAAKSMVLRSGGRQTVPQIFFGQRHVGGADDLAALDRSGELSKLVSAD
ncbi:glutaredoxin 3 (plasmid) [Microvirga ossetica]|uniref:Glutaredoxin n=2 Tax=Microvirga ossetica TaxID=1882682 RepID=A0A1B2EWT9_9HYPH|nr:glutaredoxin 3 [Microvirga ossetica]